MQRTGLLSLSIIVLIFGALSAGTPPSSPSGDPDTRRLRVAVCQTFCIDSDVEGNLRLQPADLRSSFVPADVAQISLRPMLPTPEQAFSDLFYRRWSPRSYRKTEIPLHVQEIIFDAARWAPSCFNEQPWLVITSSGEEDFQVFLELLTRGNRTWAVNASILGFIFAKKVFDRNGKPNRWAAFDCGSAWMSIALQSSLLGLYAHGMGGIELDRVHGALGVSAEDYDVMCGFAIGVIDDPGKLPEKLLSMESPNTRKPLHAMWRRGADSPG